MQKNRELTRNEEEIKKIEKMGPFDEFEQKLEKQNCEYTFILKTNKQKFMKGSQVYLTYGKFSNRELLLHYGFSLEKNKYNYGFFKMNYNEDSQLPINSQKIELFKEAFIKNDEEFIGLKRKFKLFYQQFNYGIFHNKY